MESGGRYEEDDEVTRAITKKASSRPKETTLIYYKYHQGP